MHTQVAMDPPIGGIPSRLLAGPSRSQISPKGEIAVEFQVLPFWGNVIIESGDTLCQKDVQSSSYPSYLTSLTSVYLPDHYLIEHHLGLLYFLS